MGGARRKGNRQRRECKWEERSGKRRGREKSVGQYENIRMSGRKRNVKSRSRRRWEKKEWKRREENKEDRSEETEKTRGKEQWREWHQGGKGELNKREMAQKKKRCGRWAGREGERIKREQVMTRSKDEMRKGSEGIKVDNREMKGNKNEWEKGKITFTNCCHSNQETSIVCVSTWCRWSCVHMWMCKDSCLWSNTLIRCLCFYQWNQSWEPVCVCVCVMWISIAIRGTLSIDQSKNKSTKTDQHQTIHNHLYASL